MRIAAMISGTSHDAMDVAVADVEVDGEVIRLTPVGERSVPFEPSLREAIVAALPPASTDVGAVCELDTRLGQAFAAAAVEADSTIGEGRVELVVSHGQTLYHWVEGARARGTLQLGQPAWIAEATGVPVVADLRSRDIAAGGHGAPLVSAIDVLLLGRPAQPAAALNLGGIANLTIVGPQAEPIAFDVGPANALIDAAVAWQTDGTETYDRDGARAARGEVDEVLLQRLLNDPYYALEPPKSTGKEHFHGDYLQRVLAEHDRPVAPDDLLATLTTLTVMTVAQQCRGHGIGRLVVSGGGAHNHTLMDGLVAELPGTDVESIEAIGLGSDVKEAYAFAVLGFLSVNGVPGAVPSCTGASRATVLGAVLPGGDGQLPRSSVPAGWRPTQLIIEDGT